MEIFDNASALRIAAIQNRPAFNAAYSQAPEAVRFKGRVLSRDVAQAQGVEAQLSYLAVVAMVAPEELHGVANANTYGLDGPSYGLDADKSALTAAIANQRKHEAALAKAQRRIPQIDREVVRWTGKLAACAVVDGTDVGLAIITLGIGTGIKHTICEGEAKDNLQKLGNERAKVLDEIENEKSEVVAAAQSVKDEQDAYDEATKRLRAEEEAARLEKLAKQVEEAKAQQSRDEAEAAQKAQLAAAQAASDRAKNAQDAAAYAAANPDTGQSGYTDDYGNQWANPDDYMLDAEGGEDVFGHSDVSADLGASPPEQADTGYSSPWDFDRYYGCDCAQNGDADEGYGCDACEAVYGLDGTSYGADTGNVIGGIVAGVLVAAPAVISAFTDKPGDTSSGGTKLGEKDEQGGSAKTGKSSGVFGSFTDTVLRETGFQSTIDKHAKETGDAAGRKISQTVWLVGGLIGVVGIAFVVSRKG